MSDIIRAPTPLSEERQPKRLKEIPNQPASVVDSDVCSPLTLSTTQSIELISQTPSLQRKETKTTKSEPAKKVAKTTDAVFEKTLETAEIVVKRKEAIKPELLKQAVAKTVDALDNKSSKTVQIIEIDDDDDDMGSVCSEAESDLSENLTLAQIANRSQPGVERDSEEAYPVHDGEELPTNISDDSRHLSFNTIAKDHQEMHVDLTIDENREQTIEVEKGAPEQVRLALVKACFICGCSFARISTGYKGRLNHIKRCSKKHGVTAQDMKFNDDDEDFQASPTTPYNPNNPYTRRNEAWHGDAAEDLKLAGDPAKQTTLTSFFEAPAKSLNNVLMAGAKRVAKTGDLLLAVAQKKNQQQTAGKVKKKSWGYSSGYSNTACPPFKKISGCDFVVDGFMYTKSCTTKNYFLTHFHSDHYGGITKAWCAGVIYCSLPTANLVQQQLGVDRKYLHPLGMNSPVIIESEGKPVTVTLLDANHCPGAVMFLFQVGRRHILHVGDFRWNRDKMSPDLREFSALKIRLDDLYLDTTYCNEKYRLPTQEEAISAAVEKAVQEMELARKTGRRLLMLFGAYTIGKERIYLAVAEKLGLKVYVEKRRYRILSALNWPAERMRIFTTDKEASCLWVVPLGHINFKKLSMYVDGSTKVFSSKQKYDKIVGFRPTGWSLTGCTNGILSTRTSGLFTVHGVPYSEHSSFPELVDCLDCLKPKRIIPTVSVSKSEEQVALLLKELSITKAN